MTLLDGRIGGIYVVTELKIEEHVMRRLEALGINEGTRIEVFNKKKKGAVIIKVRGTRWALGRQIAGGIEVKENVG